MSERATSYLWLVLENVLLALTGRRQNAPVVVKAFVSTHQYNR